MQTNSFDSNLFCSSKESEASDLAALVRQITALKASSSYWNEVLADYDEYTLKSLADLANWPTLAKADLIDKQDLNSPYGGLINPNKTPVKRLFYSPGPIIEPQVAGENDSWKMANALIAAGFNADDIVVNCFSYHLTPAGFMFDDAVAEIGAPVFPAGVGNTETIVQAINHFKITAYVGTPDFLKVILLKADQLGQPINSIKKALVTGGALFPDLRKWYQDRGIEICQCYGTAELGLIGFEVNGDAQGGLVVNNDCYVEIVGTGTDKPVKDGEVGEVVVTTFNREYSLIRFATGDLSAYFTDDNGVRRLRGWLGRADQTTKVRGMFVHPKQVIEVAERFSSVSKIRVEISEQEGQDSMVFYCESEDESDDLREGLDEIIRAKCRLRATVEFVQPNSLPNDGKVIVDNRQIGI